MSAKKPFYPHRVFERVGCRCGECELCPSVGTKLRARALLCGLQPRVYVLGFNAPCVWVRVCLCALPRWRLPQTRAAFEEQLIVALHAVQEANAIAAACQGFVR